MTGIWCLPPGMTRYYDLLDVDGDGELTHEDLCPAKVRVWRAVVARARYMCAAARLSTLAPVIARMTARCGLAPSVVPVVLP